MPAMKRYVVAGVIQAIPALLLAWIVACTVLLDEGAASVVPILLTAASLASAALAFLSYARLRARLPFLLAELCWTIAYALPLAADLARSAVSAGLPVYEGTDPVLHLTLALGSAAGDAGASIVRSICLALLALHAICLVLGLSGWAKSRKGCCRMR